MANAIKIQREITTVGGAKVSIGIVGMTSVFTFVMVDGPMSGMEIVAARGKKRAAKVQAALLAHESAEFWPLRHAAFAAKAAPVAA